MASSKSSAEGDGYVRNLKDWVILPFKRSADQYGDRCCRKPGDRVPPVNYGFQLTNWVTSFQYPGKGDRCYSKWKEWSHTRVVFRKEWAQRWRCLATAVPSTPSQKWGCTILRTFFYSTCFVSALRYKLHCKTVPLLVTVVAISSLLPKCKAAVVPSQPQEHELGLDDDTADSGEKLDSDERLDVDKIILGPDEKVLGPDEKVLGPDEKILGPDEKVLGPDEKILGPDEKLDFDGLPSEIQGRVLGYLPYEKVFQLKVISSTIKTLAESDEFQASPSRKKPTLTACYFFIENEVWKWAGFDASSKQWRLLPPLKCLPLDCKPDPDLFKEFLICAKDGLVCINFSEVADRERLIVFNPLSGVWKELPPLNHRRSPVMMHMLVNPDTKAYQVIVAGSSKSGDEHLCKITEVFDSCTGIWKTTGDVSGPLFALNEFQSGVHQDGKIFCIGFVEENGQVGKGIMGYDVEKEEWSLKWMHLLPSSMSATILQLVENNGEVFLFSEREVNRSTEHWIDRLEWTSANGDEAKNTCQLTTVIQKKKAGGRSLEVYPEYVCTPYGEGQLCILNAIDHTGVVYNIQEQWQSESPLEARPEENSERGFKGELGFFSLNPMSFTVEPRFSSKVYQPNKNAEEPG